MRLRDMSLRVSIRFLLISRQSSGLGVNFWIWQATFWVKDASAGEEQGKNAIRCLHRCLPYRPKDQHFTSDFIYRKHKLKFFFCPFDIIINMVDIMLLWIKCKLDASGIIFFGRALASALGGQQFSTRWNNDTISLIL